jgi:hypothetical protein
MITKVAIAALTLMAMAPQQAKGQYPGWHTNTARAFQEARQTGKPLFIVFR